MKQQTTVLVTSQDESSRVCEARRRRIEYTRNPVTLLTTENDKSNGWINGIVKLIEDQKTRMEKNNEESKTTLSITSLENDRVEITVFVLIHNFTGYTNGNAGAPAAIVPAPAAGGCCYEDRGTAHAWKITASLNNQSESLCENWSTPTKLEDLRWTDRPIDESYRRQFLESFARYNEILRAHGNYYAARTSRYTTVQSRLMPCIAVPYDKRKRQVVEDPRRSFDSKRLKESQTYRIILTDKKPSDNVTVTEVESLRKENELLGRALRKAADLHSSMVTQADATLREKEKLVEERQALENERSDLLERGQAENERLTEERRTLQTAKQDLRENVRQLEETRRCLDLQTQRLAVRKEELENRYDAMASGLAARERLLEEQRRNLEQDRDELSVEKTELQRSREASTNELHTREQSLERQRQSLVQDRQEFVERKEMFERSNEAKVSDLRDQEILAEQQRQRLERDRAELAAQSERLRQQETASASNLRTREQSLERQRQELAQDRQDLAEWAETVERSNEASASDLREQERLVEQQRAGLERDRAELAAQSERLRQQETASASNLRSREQSLERQRQDLAQDRQDLAEWAETVEISNAATASDLRDQEGLAAQQRQRLERDQRELAEQRERLRQQETARATSRRQQEASLEERRRVLEQFEEELVARRRDFEEYHETRIGNLREMEASVEADRRALERDRRRLSTREDELRRQRNAARPTPPTDDYDVAFSARSVNDGWKGRVKLPLISPVPWQIKLPWR